MKSPVQAARSFTSADVADLAQWAQQNVWRAGSGLARESGQLIRSLPFSAGFGFMLHSSVYLGRIGVKARISSRDVAPTRRRALQGTVTFVGCQPFYSGRRERDSALGLQISHCRHGDAHSCAALI